MENLNRYTSQVSPAINEKMGVEDWNDIDLWEVARSTLPRVQRERMESLHHKQQSKGLTKAEQEVQRLEELYLETILVRAKAAVLLKQQNYGISDPNQFAPDPNS